MAQVERILILAKTYPSPSAQYVETSCVAGINEHGAMRRIYPVPFRLVEQNKQFKKWQWLEARVRKSRNDHRPESHRIDVDTIVCGASLTTKKGWAHRRQWLDKLPTFDSVQAMDEARSKEGLSLALLCPKDTPRLEIKKARHSDWTKEEKEKLLHHQMQGSLFSESETRRDVQQLRKIPFDFYYRYGEPEDRLKIVDWEAGALFWNCRKSHGPGWETPFRAKIEAQLGGTDLMFLMGNQLRFQNQWLIVSLIYPPRQKPDEQFPPSQQTLF